jgi:hypothetical protein
MSAREHAYELLAIDPPTHLAPGAWRALVEALLAEQPSTNSGDRTMKMLPKLGQTVIYRKAESRTLAAIVCAVHEEAATVNLVVFTERASVMQMLDVPLDQIEAVEAVNPVGLVSDAAST